MTMELDFFENQVIIVRDIDVPEHATVHKYIYTSDNKFIVNEEFEDIQPSFTITEEMYTEMQSNIDYLMLLNDTIEE